MFAVHDKSLKKPVGLGFGFQQRTSASFGIVSPARLSRYSRACAVYAMIVADVHLHPHLSRHRLSHPGLELYDTCIRAIFGECVPVYHRPGSQGGSSAIPASLLPTPRKLLAYLPARTSRSGLGGESPTSWKKKGKNWVLLLQEKRS